MMIFAGGSNLLFLCWKIKKKIISATFIILFNNKYCDAFFFNTGGGVAMKKFAS